ncbi:MAG TPA: sigma 54-interacting transcriptional regulator [Verrucomicrobiae bacterium]|nr:sigma 54-interacting transcriptional regulator [Verrucomicrobiae bacterium]
MSSKQLPAASREFLQIVSQASFINPFSDEFAVQQRRIANCDTSVTDEEQIKLMVARWNDHLHALNAAGVTNLKQVTGEDRELLQYAFLYEIYHRFLMSFDELITDQMAAGTRPVVVPFASKALALFSRRGFEVTGARRYFAIFYQIRRAYYFIDRGLIGRSPCMRQLRLHLWNNVFTHNIRWYELHLWNRMEDFSTMLLGETGTGKGAAAAAIGRSGFIPFDERRDCFAESFTRGFVSLNLSQFPETLIESELFGHKKGAFTGAVEDHEGVLSRCSPHGAIFLDEIGDATIPVQIKLLHVLQERTFSPVGSHDKKRFRGRVIAATNRPLDQLRATGQFRDDFYYRLCSDVITVPPLRQRIAEDTQELDDLVAHLVQRITGQASTEAVNMVQTALDSELGRNYPWPGNVRELEQAVRRILLTRHYAGDHKAIAPDLRSQLVAGVEHGTLDTDAILSGYCQLLYERHGTYEEVARRTKLDRRTVKAYLEKRRAVAGRG